MGNCRDFQIFDSLLKQKGLRSMLIPGFGGLLELVKDLLFLGCAFFEPLFQRSFSTS